MNEADIFAIIPATQRWGWLWLLFGAVLALVIGVIIAGIYSIWAANHATVSLEAKGLRIRGGFYSRTVPLEALHPEQAKMIDFASSPELAPVARRNGIGLPGLQAGWFRLRNNEKALIFVTDPSQVVYLPTSKGYSLLFSLKRPQAFIDKLGNMS